jgi:GTP cyclohydrolase IA
VEYEKLNAQRQRLLTIGRELLEAIGEDTTRPGIADTPRRFADWWMEFLNYDAGRVDTTFESVLADQLVTVNGIRVWSLCEHHLLPFWCDVSIGYIATDRVLGLSKFARIAQKHAHRLQLQEQLVRDIADDIQAVTGTANVAVYAKGEHLCMSMRGVKSPAMMTSSVMRGSFRDDNSARSEFLRIVLAP